MPLKDGDCYRLFATVLDNRGVQVNPSNTDQIKIGFTVRFNKVNAYDLLIAAVRDGDIKTNALFVESNETDTAGFSAAKIATHLEKARDQLAAGKTVNNAITGTMIVEESAVEIFAELISDTNVIIASQTYKHTK